MGTTHSSLNKVCLQPAIVQTNHFGNSTSEQTPKVIVVTTVTPASILQTVVKMDSHNIFYTVDGHGTQTSYHLRRRHHHHHHHSNSNHTLPRLSDHFQQSTPATSAMHSNSTGLAPSVFQSNSNRSIDPLSTSSSPSLPQGLPSCNSTPTHSHNHLTSTLSSPVSFDSHSHSSIGSNSNGILCTDVSNRGQTSFISIARNNNARLSKRTLLQGFSSSAAHYPNDSDSNLDLLDSIAKMHPQAALVITDDDMDHAACYCFDRGGGNYTPLVPIDRLPADVLGLLPARVTSDENMIVLPEPRLAGDAATNQTIAKFADLAVTVSSYSPFVSRDCDARLLGSNKLQQGLIFTLAAPHCAK